LLVASCSLMGLSGAGASAKAIKIGVPDLSYVYFHKAGETIETHNEALRRCMGLVEQLYGPHAPDQASLTYRFDAPEIGGNLESCMLVNGWEVVRIDPAQGKRLRSLDPETLSDLLAPWVGSDSPPGMVIRRFKPFDQSWIINFDYGPPHGQVSLSQKASGVESPVLPYRWEYPAAWKAIYTTNPEKVGAGSAVIVIRLASTIHRSTQYTLVRLDQSPIGPDGVPMTVIDDFAPTNIFRKPGMVLERFDVFVVPPGRWILAGIGGVNFCMGAPVFDVKEGEAVYAGSFLTGDETAYAPDMSLDGAKAALAGTPEIAGRLKPAQYMNGAKFWCGLALAHRLYTLDIPGAPPVG
jgi:hypothetical protein